MEAVGIIASAQLAAQEGGGAPEWLEDMRSPGGDLPAAAFDFLGENYWASGAAAQEGDVIDLGAASITAEGLDIPDSGDRPELLGAVQTLAFSRNWTAVIKFTPKTALECYVLNIKGTDTDDYISIQAFASGEAYVIEQANNGGDLRFTDNSTISYAVDEEIGCAVTITSAKIAASFSGAAIVSDSTAIASNDFAAVVLGGDSVNFSDVAVVIHSIAFYEPQDDADLPTLSAVA